jgi:ornithine carbamoyltransferase
MHDMPIHPDYEIAEDMIEDESSIIYDQAENRLDAQKAIMLHVHRHMK